MTSTEEERRARACRLIENSLVWDNHTCMPLRPHDTTFLPQLERNRAAGIDVISGPVAGRPNHENGSARGVTPDYRDDGGSRVSGRGCRGNPGRELAPGSWTGVALRARRFSSLSRFISSDQSLRSRTACRRWSPARQG